MVTCDTCRHLLQSKISKDRIGSKCIYCPDGDYPQVCANLSCTNCKLQRVANTKPHSDMVVNLSQGFYVSIRSEVPIQYKCPKGHEFLASPLSITTYDVSVHCSEKNDTQRQLTCPSVANVLARYLRTMGYTIYVKKDLSVYRLNGEKVQLKTDVEDPTTKTIFDIDSTTKYKDGSLPPRYMNKYAQMVAKTRALIAKQYRIIRLIKQSLVTSSNQTDWKMILAYLINNASEIPNQISIIGESKYAEEYSLYVKILRSYGIMLPVILYSTDSKVVDDKKNIVETITIGPSEDDVPKALSDSIKNIVIEL